MAFTTEDFRAAVAKFEFMVARDSTQHERMAVHCGLSHLNPSQPVGPYPCVRCGRPVEETRRCYAIPHCYGCLPPPPPLETVELPGAKESPSGDGGGTQG